MKKDSNTNMKKERIIMIASSVFVLTALTMTGLYMRSQQQESQDDGYTIDFTALENSVEKQSQENTQSAEQETENDSISWSSSQTEGTDAGTPATGNSNDKKASAGKPAQGTLEDDMDYMPLEAGSSDITVMNAAQEQADVPEAANLPEEAEPQVMEEAAQEAVGESVEIGKELNFSEADGLVRPVSGDILMHYNMSGTTYFATLAQYKYNPAVVISAIEGTSVSACAEGRVVSIFSNEEIGNAVTLDLGNGYQATYGQLKDILVTEDSYVNAGDTIASVAAPTKYYCVEGCNVYFELRKNDTPVNPENLF